MLPGDIFCVKMAVGFIGIAVLFRVKSSITQMTLP